MVKVPLNERLISDCWNELEKMKRSNNGSTSSAANYNNASNLSIGDATPISPDICQPMTNFQYPEVPQHLI